MTVAHYYLPASVPEALGLLARARPGAAGHRRRHGRDAADQRGHLAAARASWACAGPAWTGSSASATSCTSARRRTLTRLVEQDDVPLLRQAASRTASWSIRNMATVGGNLFTPPPGGDVATALLALDARVVVDRPAGARDPAAGRLLDRLPDHRPRPPTSSSPRSSVPLDAGRTAFVKFGRKAANTPSVVTVAVRRDDRRRAR